MEQKQDTAAEPAISESKWKSLERWILLAAGGVAVIPTDTVYGLAAHPGFPDAVERLYTIKGRESGKKIALLASDVAAIEAFGFSLSEKAEKLAAKNAPKPEVIYDDFTELFDKETYDAEKAAEAKAIADAKAEAKALKEAKRDEKDAKREAKMSDKYDAATAAHKSTDSVKIADSKGFIDSSADRETVWLAQTPQIFKTKLYRAAAYTAIKKGFEGTDDNMLVENVKHPIRLVECGAQNIKITTLEDLPLAAAILSYRED